MTSAMMPTINADSKPTLCETIFSMGSDCISSDFNPIAPMMPGMESRNENVAASLRFDFKKSAVAIVIPDREMPGKSATDWAMPMINACFIDIFEKSSRDVSELGDDVRFVNQRTVPVIKRPRPAARIDPKLCSIKSNKENPTIATGTDPMTSRRMARGVFNALRISLLKMMTVDIRVPTWRRRQKSSTFQPISQSPSKISKILSP